MKPFTLFFGAYRQVGTFDVTSDPQYSLVVNTVTQLRKRLLKQEVLRQPFLQIFRAVHQHRSEFPDDSEPQYPFAMSNIVEFRDRPPTDDDVVGFLTSSFPDLYLHCGYFGPEDVDRVTRTCSEQRESDKANIEINARVVQHLFQAVSVCHLLTWCVRSQISITFTGV